MTLTRAAAAASAAALALAALTGCGTGPLSSNKGGDTECADYLEMTTDEQRDVIDKYFEEKGNSEPAGFETNLALQSAKLYCNTMGSPSDPIRKIDTG